MEFTPSETPEKNPIGDETSNPHTKKNLYPFIRHIFLIACICACVAIFIFLFYQNGKSIYDNGI